MKKLITIFLICSALVLTADIINWSEISFRTFLTNNDEDIQLIIGESADGHKLINTDAKAGLNWKHQLRMDLTKNWNLLLDNNLFYSDVSQENLNAYFFNYSKLRLSYADDSQNLKLQFSNRAFTKDNSRWLTITGTEQTTRQNMVNAVEVQYKKYLNNFTFGIYTKMRNLNYSYLEESLDDEDDKDGDDSLFNGDENYKEVKESENDLFTRTQIDYQLNDVFKLFTTAYYKDDMNEECWYNHTQIGGGFEYFNKYDFFNILRFRFTYLNNTSDRMNNEKDHYFISHLRYTKRIGMNFAAFASYENRSCYDNDSSKLLRISNQLRVQVKYSYLNNGAHDSYVTSGFVLNEEIDNSSLFAEVNQNLFGTLYGTVFTRIAADRYFKVSETMECFLKPDKSFWLKHEYTDFDTAPAQHLIYVGSTLLF